MIDLKIAKMQDKEKLKKLVQIIGELIKVEGNDWLVEDLLKEVGDTYSVNQLANYPIINEIHEHCIKEVIKKQAKDFYHRLPIDDDTLRESLIYDFTEMEYNRRRDRFYEFSFCVNQQIEAMVNYLFKDSYREEWRSLSKEIKDTVVKSFPDKKTKKEISLTLQECIISLDKEKKNEWSDLSKFRLVFYFMDTKNPKKLPYEFYPMSKLRSEISQARNETHRGGEKRAWQKEILLKIQGNESKYYFKFYGFLQDFVSRIELSYTPERNSGYKQTLGDSNPELEILKQKMEKNESKSTTN